MRRTAPPLPANAYSTREQLTNPGQHPKQFVQSTASPGENSGSAASDARARHTVTVSGKNVFVPPPPPPGHQGNFWERSASFPLPPPGYNKDGSPGYNSAEARPDSPCAPPPADEPPPEPPVRKSEICVLGPTEENANNVTSPTCREDVISSSLTLGGEVVFKSQREALHAAEIDMSSAPLSAEDMASSGNIMSSGSVLDGAAGGAHTAGARGEATAAPGGANASVSVEAAEGVRILGDEPPSVTDAVPEHFVFRHDSRIAAGAASNFANSNNSSANDGGDGGTSVISSSKVSPSDHPEGLAGKARSPRAYQQRSGVPPLAALVESRRMESDEIVDRIVGDYGNNTMTDRTDREGSEGFAVDYGNGEGQAENEGALVVEPGRGQLLLDALSGGNAPGDSSGSDGVVNIAAAVAEVVDGITAAVDPAGYSSSSGLLSRNLREVDAEVAAPTGGDVHLPRSAGDGSGGAGEDAAGCDTADSPGAQASVAVAGGGNSAGHSPDAASSAADLRFNAGCDQRARPSELTEEALAGLIKQERNSVRFFASWIEEVMKCRILLGSSAILLECRW